MRLLKAVREVLNNDKDVYDPRKYLGPAREAIKETVKGKIREFGTSNRAKFKYLCYWSLNISSVASFIYNNDRNLHFMVTIFNFREGFI